MATSDTTCPCDPPSAEKLATEDESLVLGLILDAFPGVLQATDLSRKLGLDPASFDGKDRVDCATWRLATIGLVVRADTVFHATPAALRFVKLSPETHCEGQ